MKKYTLLGELLTDYRTVKNITQVELAAKMNVDVRTAIRWEANKTLINPEKEEDLVKETFIPHQVIRNLNATVAIPTYYDFRIRKYSLAERSNELPDTEWLKAQIETPTNRIRSIESKSDIDNILRYSQYQHSLNKPINRQLIIEATKILPELNLVIVDDTGHYSGHCVAFLIRGNTYNKIRNHEITERELTLNDLAVFRKGEKSYLYFYDVTADCNENVFYLAGAVLKFFKELQNEDYIVSSLTHRYDTHELNNHLGLEIIWEDKEVRDIFGNEIQARFYEGDFKDFFGES